MPSGIAAIPGADQRTGSLFSFVDLEARVRPDHLLRPIREIVNAAFDRLSSAFDALSATGAGRSSIPAERLLRALPLQALLRPPLGAADHGTAGV